MRSERRGVPTAATGDVMSVDEVLAYLATVAT